MQLSAQHTADMASATSPEEAYKLFAKAASQAIGQAIADSLAKVIGATGVQMAATNPAIAGWEQYITGLVMNVEWGSPITMSASRTNCIVSGQYDPTETAALGVSGSISIGISVGF